MPWFLRPRQRRKHRSISLSPPILLARRFATTMLGSRPPGPAATNTFIADRHPPTRRSALLSAPSAPPSARSPLCPRHAPLRALPGVTLLSFHSMRPATDAARHHGKCLAKHSYRRSDPIGRRFSSLPRDSRRSPRPRRFPARPASPA